MDYSRAINCMSMHASQDLVLALAFAVHISCMYLDSREYKHSHKKDSSKLRLYRSCLQYIH